ncbi:MAG: sugar transferase [Clostridia bacterium]|nr:sugar transferase [Clostridia bacterium]
MDKTEQKVYVIKAETPKGGKAYLISKRAFDIFFACVFGLFLILPMAVIALIIKLDSKGPVLFRQERLGKDGKQFIMYKFRTMILDAERDGPQWAKPDDGRCTKVGRFLRRCRLDELPQIINILRGDMSFVGPRPERPCFYEEFETYIHGFSNRLSVTPGLTGLAQVNGGYELAPEQKIVYDMEYIRTRTLLFDIKLMFKTVKLVFTHEGAR